MTLHHTAFGAATLAGLIYAHGKIQQKRPQARKDKQLRAHLKERQIDKMIMDSFPASDPPSTY